MHIGVIADTHDNVDAVHTAVNEFEDRDVDVILHCGDVIAPPVIQAFDGFEFHLVFGNNDGEQLGLAAAVDRLGNGSACHGRFARLTFDGVDIGMLHGEDIGEVDACARSGEFDYVLSGHHHETRHESFGATVVINPGGHFPTIAPDHRCVGVIDTSTGDDAIVQLDV